MEKKPSSAPNQPHNFSRLEKTETEQSLSESEQTKKLVEEILASEEFKKKLEETAKNPLPKNPPTLEELAKSLAEETFPKIFLTFVTKPRGEELNEKRQKKIEIQFNKQTELIQAYLDAVEEVKATKKLQPHEKLAKLLSPLIAVSKIYWSEDRYKFIDEEYIDLNKEIEQGLNCDRSKYEISGDGEFEKLGRLNTRVRTISLTPDPGQYSVSRIYEVWLPTLNQGSMRSKDLLTQIFVCYTIKRALNGDERARNKLYDLYETKAISIAKRIMKYFLEREEAWKWIKEEGKIILWKSIKEQGKIILKQLIAGFSPAMTIDSLIHRGKSVIPIIPIQKRIVKFYVWFYSEYLPQYIKEHLQEEILKTSLSARYISDLVVMLNPFHPINSKTGWIVSGGKRVNKFNSCSFIPGRGHTNLTTWLFGTKNNPMQGAFRQLLNEDVFERLAESQKELTYDPLILSISEDEDEDEDRRELAIKLKTNEEIAARDRDGDQSIRDLRDEDLIAQIKEMLSKNGISERDADIFLEIAIRERKKTYLAKKYNLSRRHIHRIYNKIKSLPLLNNKKFRRQLQELLSP